MFGMKIQPHANVDALKTFLFLMIGVMLPFMVFSTAITPKPDSGFLIYQEIANTKIFITKDKSLDFEQVSSPDFRDSFIEIPRKYLTSGDEIYWFLVDFDNIDLTGSEQWYIRFGYWDIITYYYWQNETIAIGNAGVLSKNRSPGVKDNTNIPFTPDNLIEGRFLYVQVKQYTRKTELMVPTYRNIETVDYISNFVSRYYFFNQLPYFFFIGGMLLMFFYFIGFYYMYDDRLFIWYSFYLLTLILFIGIRTHSIRQFLQSSFPVFAYIFYEILQVFVNIFYLIFARIFLNAKTDFPKLNTAIKYALTLLLFVIAIQVAVITINPYSNYATHIMNFQRYFMIVFSIAAYIYILKNYRNKLVLFLVGGSIFYLTGAILSMIFWHITYLMIGTAIEVFVFSIGMGYRIKRIEQEKHKIESEITKVRLTALKAQMNPHFIFNSLNSIRAYVISNETRKASDYITKFARLIRLILHYSSLDTITLESELEALNLYVELEQMRHRTDFGYNVVIAPELNPAKVVVPPLIFQPYVENAIGHGLAPKQGPKHLQIMIGQTTSKLIVTIRDNGVGRGFSKKAKINNDPSHQSVAMDLTSKRINLAGHNQLKNENIVVRDLFENGQPAGTEVKLHLPLQSIISTSGND